MLRFSLSLTKGAFALRAEAPEPCQRLALMESRDPDALRLDTTPSEAQARLVLPCRGTLWTTS